MSEENAPLEGNEPQGGEGEPTADTAGATLEDAAKAAITDSTAGQAESPEEFDWSKLKNADRFKGRTVQEVVDYLNMRDHQYGTQARELGELRSYREQYEALKRQATQKPEDKPRGFSEGEKFEFAKRFQDDPLGAVNEFMGPKLADALAQQVFERVNQRIGPALQDHTQRVATQTEYAHLVRNHPEIETDQELRWVTMQLMGPEYLGDNIPYEQALFLAKMSREEPSLYPTTFNLMRRGVPFEQAKKYAELEQNAPADAETKKQQLKDEVKGIRRGSKTSSRSAQTKEPDIRTMDDALDSVVKEYS